MPGAEPDALAARRARAWSTLGVADPGNPGTLLRSAEASGAAAIVLGPGSVDAYNPKVVRASAGAIFGIPLVDVESEGWTAVEALDALGELGRQRLGAAAGRGTPAHRRRLHPSRPRSCSATRPTGSTPTVDARLDGHVRIPMAGPAESLNVAMAGTVLCFESARQRAGATRDVGADDRAADGYARRRARPRSRPRRRSTSSPRPSARFTGRRLGALRAERGDQVARPGRPAGRRQGGRPTRGRASPSWSTRAGAELAAAEAAAAAERDRLDLTLGGHGRRARPPAPRHAGAARARGHLRGHGLPRGRRAPRSRTTGTTSRRSTSRPATRPARCRTRSTSSSAIPSR